MIRSALKPVYFSARSIIGAERRAIARMGDGKAITILNLHRVSPERDPYWPPLHPELFEKMARWLSENFTVTTLAQLRDLSSKRPVAVLSFDDGYYDFIEHVIPILEKYGLSANMNVIPECAETERPMWNVRLYDFLKSATPEEIQHIKIPGFAASLKKNTERAKCDFGLAISKFLKNRPMREREALWQPIQSLIDKHKPVSTRMMTTDEIRQIADKVEIGAHSYSHESMGFETDEFFSDDLRRCKAYFNDKIGIPLSIYAFPNGSYRPSQIQLLRSSGIKHILLVEEKLGQRTSDLLPRFTIYGDTSAELRFKALGIN